MTPPPAAADRPHGHRAVLLLFAGVVVLTAAVGVVSGSLISDPLLRALAGIVVLTAATLVVRPRFGSWQALGVRRRVDRPRVLLVPAVLALAPLAFGVRLPGGPTLVVLLVGYVLTGFTEELLWRGMALRALERSRPLVAVLVSSALFGLSHLVNLLYRDSPGLVYAQAWGAFCFGVGYAAVRRTTGSILWLMALHAATDLVGAVTTGPALVFFIAQDTVLLGFGLFLTPRHPPRPRAAAVRAGRAEPNP